MKLKTRLYVGFGLILALMILLMGGVLNLLDQLNEDINEVVKDRYEQVKLATGVRYDINTMSRALSNLALDLPADSVQREIEDITNAQESVANALDDLEQMGVNEQSKQWVREMKRLTHSYGSIADQIIRYAKSGQKAEATALMLGESRQVRTELFETIGSLTHYQEQRMEEVLSRSVDAYHLAARAIYIFLIVSVLIGVLITFWVIRSIARRLGQLNMVMASVAYDNTSQLPRIDVTIQDEIGAISLAFNEMASALEEHYLHEQEFKQTMKNQSWLKTKLAEMTTMYQGIQHTEQLADLFITKVTPMVGAGYGVFYLAQKQGEHRELCKIASYAGHEQGVGAERFRFGEGLVGQCALENRIILLEQVPREYIRIESGLGVATASQVLLLPIAFEGVVIGVVEFASFEPFSELYRTLLQQVVHSLGMAMNNISNYMRIEQLLKESQTMTEELQSQSEELQLQQEELRSINEKLEEQYKNSELKTLELEKIKADLEEKAYQVTRSSKYKSEFLANMSHELRTPLNSMLILSQILAENAEGNLSHKQVEFANTICSSGNDLLNLINDILDLSKVESGKMEVNLDQVSLCDVQMEVESQFMQMARSKGLEFIVRLDEDLPHSIYTDKQRLLQILKNLLSNAFKFTENGSVRLEVRKADKASFAEDRALKNNETMLAISVTDTGIGVPYEKQGIIFEAFRQADGTTSRKYGGTGLGLSISREMAQLLGGFIKIKSAEGKGSTFTLYLPSFDSKSRTEMRPSEPEVAASLSAEPLSALSVLKQPTSLVLPATLVFASEPNPVPVEPVPSDALLANKKVLVVDDDMRNVFALTTALESQQMRVVFAENGREGMVMLQEHSDIDLVLMDIMMPEMDGYEAMRAIRQLKEFQDLPIIALTAKAMKNDREKCMEAGASDYISKPVQMEQLFSLMRVWLYR